MNRSIFIDGHNACKLHDSTCIFLQKWSKHNFSFVTTIFFFNLAVCRALVDEVNHSISLVDSKQKVQVGSFRVDSKGNQKVVEVCLMDVELIHV